MCIRDRRIVTARVRWAGRRHHWCDRSFAVVRTRERRCYHRWITARQRSTACSGGDHWLGVILLPRISNDLLVSYIATQVRVVRLPGLRIVTARVPVSYIHLRSHESPEHLVCGLLL